MITFQSCKILSHRIITGIKYYISIQLGDLWETDVQWKNEAAEAVKFLVESLNSVGSYISYNASHLSSHLIAFIF